ncbi:hypothetical protein WN944_029011 [Citrus x changshan-huyou]|uniref:BURP domain-containing protein n=1 Tax=Citrus x changshan-huyou TaxID=2935761 RepID=A0AAP0LKE5_9ROSI
MDVQLHHMHIAHHSSHVDVNSSEVKIFFTLRDLKVGNKMALYLPIEDHSNSAHFLPSEEADSFPFSLKQLPYILELTSIPRVSPQAKAMEDTLRMCETDPIKDEIKTCATSLESMLDFAGSIFGSETGFKTVTTKSTSNTFQNYTILEVQEIPASKMVACHYMSYPYAIYGCHSHMTENINKVFRVSLVGDNGDIADAISACHLDTSQWNPDHQSFQILGIKPGTIPVCHYFPTDHLVFVPAAKDEFM